MSRSGRNLLACLVSVLVAASTLVVAPSQAGAANPAPVLTTFVPIPENDIRDALVAMAATSGLTIGNQIQTTISITVASDGAFLYYDHWEDGFEADIANPSQSTTQVWGDGNAANGAPPGFASDTLQAGSVIVLDNGGAISTPRVASQQRFDGGDKVASNRGFALTRAGWETTYGTLHAGAVSAYDTTRFGRNFTFPVGQNIDSNEAFEYAGLSVMAAQDGTVVRIDANGDGTIDRTVTLDQGRATFVNGGISAGGTLTASAPVDAYLITGDIGATFEGRWYELFPDSLLSDTYVAATGTTEVGTEVAIFFFNPSRQAITIDIDLATGPTSVSVPARGSASYLLPVGSGGRFRSPGHPFHAVSATGAFGSNSSENDWGYSLVPEQLLTTGVIVGWGPGASDGVSNMSPVWVAPLADTTVFVDYDGDPSNGYDVARAVRAYESATFYDPDGSMTGARLYTTDGTPITAAWGQDPLTASPGAPALDLGSAIMPSTALVIDKSAVLQVDADADGLIGPGDTLRFTVDVLDAAALALTNTRVVDVLPSELDYVPGSSRLDGAVIADDVSGTPFPLDGAGYTVPLITAGGNARFTFDTVLSEQWPLLQTQLQNRVTATANEASGSDSIELPVQIASLGIEKRSNATGPVRPGDSVDFSVSIGNAGTIVETGVGITDVLPAGLALTNATLTSFVDGSSGAALDSFPAASFSNSNGSLPWATPWTDVDSGGAGVASGDVRVVSFGGSQRLRVRSALNSARRTFDASTYERLTLSFDYSRQSLDDATEHVAVQVSRNGGAAWTELAQFAGPSTDAGFLTASYDLSAFANSSVIVRFVGSATLESDDTVYIDEVRISALERNQTTVSAGTGPIFASGLDLYPGETATVLLSTTIDANVPDGAREIVNTASVTSDTSGPREALTRLSVAPGSIGDRVFADIDGDGIQDGTESGIEGVTVRLYDGAGTLLDTRSTDVNGDYRFVDLASGDVRVAIDTASLPAGTVTPTTDRDGVLDDETLVALGIGEDVDDADFGYQPLGVIGDMVFADDDGDSTLGAGESGLAGIRIELLDGSGTLVDSTTTDGAGFYSFADRPAGSYVVRVDVSTLPSDTTTQSADPDAIADAQTVVVLTPGGSVTDADFGFQPLGSIGDVVFADIDADGLRAGGEDGLPGIGIELLDGAGAVVDTTTTAADGSYRFEALPAGKYTVRVDVSTLPVRTTTATIDRDGSLDHETTILLGPGQDVDDADFGYQPLGSIGDSLFADHDGNGSRRIGEPPLVGVRLELLDVGGAVIGTAVTDAAGRYRFDDLATGDYTVRVDVTTLPARTVTPTTDRDGVADGETFVSLAPGEVVDDADFGFQPLGSIGDRVYRDDDGDGAQDPGEPGLAGVVVELLDASGVVIGTETTDAAGDYRFDDLPTDDYTIVVSAATLPTGVTTATADRDAVPDGSTLVSLAPAQVVGDADFGFQPLGFIGDRVFADFDGDGSQDPGEPGLSGVTVELLDAWGARSATATTDASGGYGFAGLPIGTYTVQVDVTSLPPSTTGQTADPDAVMDARHEVILLPGASVTTVDFGFQPLGSIGDTVFADHDGDGVQDPGEPGLAGVTVGLFSPAGAALTSATTDATGRYRFDALPTADYEVRIDSGTLPTRTTTATTDRDAVPDGATTLTLAPGAAIVDADFGYQPLGSIGDTVYADLDGDGVRSSGEPGLDGVTVDLLDASGVTIASIVTAGGGTYVFSDIPTADYTIRVDATTLPANTTTQTDDPDGTNDGRTTLTLAPGGLVTDADFGYRPLGSLGDLVFTDLDGDGTQDAGEPGLPGVIVELRDGSGSLLSSAVTDASGSYRFPDLAAGTYEVRIEDSTLPASTTTPTTDRDGVLDGSTVLTLVSGQIVDDVDFGYQPLGAIGDTVYADLDGNGSQDPGEPGLPGVTVELLDAGGTLLATTSTGSGGAYSFPGRPAGSYAVRIDTSSLPSTTVTPTGDRDGVLDGQTVVTLGAGSSIDDADFGFQPLGSIGDTVFADDDGDGVQSPGEPGLAGVTVDLLDGSGAVLSTTITNGFGHYSFGSLPGGTFTVRIDVSTLPTNATTATADLDTVFDNETTVVLPAGGAASTADFGYRPVGSIGDTVFADDDGNGSQDIGESGLAGVIVELLDGSGVLIRSASTDGSGAYSFDGLVSGSYTVRVVAATLPSTTTTPTVDRDADSDGSTTVLLASGATIDDADFGYQPLGSIGDTVFADDDGDGNQTSGEPGLAAVSIELLDGSASTIATTTTDAVGAYRFDGLATGTYTVRIDVSTLPAWTTTATADRDGLLDDRTTVALAPGESVTDADFGYQPLGSIGDTVFADGDGDGTQTPGEPGLAGVSVELLDGAGAVIATAITDAGGGFRFDGLPAGSFSIRVVTASLLADTTTATADRDGIPDGITSLVLAPGGVIDDADFGYQPLGSIGDTIFADLDGDGSFDLGEPGLDGVTIELLDVGGLVIATTTTDAAGRYRFDGLPAAAYTVRVDGSSLPADTTTPTADRDGVFDGVTSLTLGPGVVIDDADFGFQPLGSIGDTVFADHDGNGIQTAGEPGLAGVSVELIDVAGTVLATTTTGPAGSYSFAALPVGSYTVRVDVSTLPGNTRTPTADRDGVFDAATTVALPAGSSILDADFGFRPVGSIGDTVFADEDGDGVQTTGEPGLPGVALDLLDDGGSVLASTTTDVTGGYRFDALPAADYRVRVDVSTLPTNTRLQTADPDGTPDDATDVTLAPGAVVGTADFGYRPLGSIGDEVYADDNGDGDRDATETGLAGVRVELRSGAGGLIDSAVTDASGRYVFSDLVGGDYLVRIDAATLPLNSTTPTGDRDGVADGSTALTLGAGEAAVDVDFGFRPLGSIGDVVFADLDGNGLRDPGETGIGGVTLELLDAAGSTIASTVTDASGVYGFDALVGGIYTVRVLGASLPTGHDHPTVDRDAVADRETLVILAPGQSVADADFGFQPLGSIGDLVFADLDGRGFPGPGELGLGGVDVELVNGTGATVAVATTDGTGRYRFGDLPSGDYTIRVVASTLPLRTGTATGDRDLVADGVTSLTLGAGAVVDDADFGFQPLGSIGDLVFADVDGDGVRDTDEPGLAGVTVELFDDLGVLVDSTATDSVGAYGFGDVPSGSYTVRIDGTTLPAGTTTPTIDRDGSADGETVLVLGPAEVIIDADFGFQPLGAIGDLVWADVDGDGLRDLGEPGLSGVTVRLLDAGGLELATRTTDGSGGYLFAGLAAGDYVVRIDESSLPASTTTRTSDPDGVVDGATLVPLLPAAVVVTADFGYQPLGSIGDTVFADVDGNGVQGVGEPGLAAVVLELLDAGGSVIATTTTDALGAYRFDGLTGRDHTVRVDASTLPVNTTTATADRDGTADGATTVSLAPGQDVDDADFGFQPLGSIGDTVYADDDGNGSQDVGELGLGAVTVELLDGSGTVVASTDTDASGSYFFAGLPAATYTVRVVTSTLPASTTTATGDRDGVLDGSTSLTLAPGEAVTDVDFGFQPTGTIGTTIFGDLDGNGVQDVGDDGLGGVAVDLLDDTGTVIASTVTNGFGNYSFGSLSAGTYSVRVDGSTLPATTTTPTADRDGVFDGRTTVGLAPGQAVDDVDFGFRPLGSIGDTVFRDDDGDGTQDASEPGLAAVTVELLDGAGTVVSSVLTDATGTYSFPGLGAGSYTVVVDAATLPPGNTTPTADPDVVPDGRTTLNLAPGELVVDADFGFQPRGAIGDLVFADLDGDGIADVGELGLAGVTLELLDGSGAVLASTTTDATGAYRFDDLPVGDHTIRVDITTLPPGTTVPTVDRDGVADSITIVTLGPAEVVDDADFGFVPLGSIGDLVFGDDDGNGSFDTGESGLAGVTVELLDGSGAVIAATATDAAGAYRFDALLAAGYTVRVDTTTLPVGVSTATVDRDAVPDGETTLTLDPAAVIDDADFGFRTRGAIGDRVFRDDNGNGVADAGEPGIAGVVLELLDGTGAVVAATATDADGAYRFDSLLPGVHVVRVDVASLPVGTTTQTADRDAVLDSSTTVTLVAGEVVTDADFGYRAFGSIGATVWSDPDGDGSRNAGEPAIPGVTIELLDASGVVLATTMTDLDGNYLFDSLPAATYVVRVDTSTLPVDTTTPTADLDGVLDGSTSIALGVGEAVRTPSFGFRPLAVIGDTVWFDRNGDGLEDAGEIGVSGVTLELLDAAGAVVATTVTDGSGRYRFGGLVAGDYTVRIDVATLPSSALSPTSDADGVPDHRASVTVAVGEIVDRMDFGYLPAPDTGDVAVVVYADLDRDGVMNNGDTGLDGVVVQLVDGAGAVLAETTSGPDGAASFTGLAPGPYTVRIVPETLPSGVRNQTEDPDAVVDHASSVTVVAGAVDGPSVFGYAPDPEPVGSIDGTIFDDLDRDSAPGPDELPVTGVVVILYDGAGVELRRTTTDTDGRYGFVDLPLGPYQVEVVPPVDRELSPPSNVDGESEFGADRRSGVVLTANGQVELVWGGLVALQPNGGTTTLPPTTLPPTTLPPTTLPPTTLPPTTLPPTTQPTSIPPTTSRDSAGISPQVGDSAQIERPVGAGVDSPPTGSLAFTGSDVGFLVAVAGWLLAIGVGLVLVARRRRPDVA